MRFRCFNFCVIFRQKLAETYGTISGACVRRAGQEKSVLKTLMSVKTSLGAQTVEFVQTPRAVLQNF